MNDAVYLLGHSPAEIRRLIKQAAVQLGQQHRQRDRSGRGKVDQDPEWSSSVLACRPAESKLAVREWPNCAPHSSAVFPFR
jgi:hypothetical protein